MLSLGTTKHVARKAHRCENCGGRINPGQVYIRARVVDGGDAWVWKSHDDCQKASELLFKAGIEGDDGGLPLLSNFDAEDRALVRMKAPELAERLWPKQMPGVCDV